jgi:hypothetical protein
VQPNRVFDEIEGLGLGVTGGVAALEGRTNGDVSTIFVSLHYHRELILSVTSPSLRVH